ncbi:MAG: heme-binding beta-barrel domain-containing protein [Candidatus Dormibacteria bacterium]
MPTSDVQALLAPFRSWLGAWEGEGSGRWSDPPFRYRERLVLQAVPDRAVVTWDQRTEVLDTGDLSHSERGYLRLLQGGEVELVLAIPAGYTEIQVGRLRGETLVLSPGALGVTPSARRLDRVGRRLQLEDSVLVHEILIAVGDAHPAPHVLSRLRRHP